MRWRVFFLQIFPSPSGPIDIQLPWFLPVRALNTVANNKVAQTNKVHKFKLCERIILRSNGIWEKETSHGNKKEKKQKITMICHFIYASVHWLRHSLLAAVSQHAHSNCRCAPVAIALSQKKETSSENHSLTILRTDSTWKLHHRHHPFDCDFSVSMRRRFYYEAIVSS